MVTRFEKKGAMPAPKKLTAQMDAAIVRRRLAGESLKSIARDYGIAHQTVSKLAKTHPSPGPAKTNGPRIREEAADAPDANPPPGPLAPPPKPFANWEERYCYYQSLSPESKIDWHNFQDVKLGRETPAERTSRLTGTPLKLR